MTEIVKIQKVRSDSGKVVRGLFTLVLIGKEIPGLSDPVQGEPTGMGAWDIQRDRAYETYNQNPTAMLLEKNYILLERVLKAKQYLQRAVLE